MKLVLLDIIILGLCILCQYVEAHILVYRVETNQLITVFNDLPAQFGPSLPPNGLKVYPYPAFPIDACNDISPAPKLGDRKTVAIIQRGGNCTFELKVRKAQKAGFNAAIVFNYDSDDLEQMSAQNSTGIRIPSVFIGQTAGDELLSDSRSEYVLEINDELPFNINTQLILPFSILIGLCFLIMIFYMIYKCIREERRLRRYRLPKRLLKKLPIIKYTKNNDLAYDTCVICLEDFAEGDKLRILPCRHPYHSYCIDPWLTENRRVCPICKRKVFTKGEVRSNRNRQSSLDSVTDTDDDTTPLLQPPGSTATNSAAAASATRHGTFRREGNAVDDTTSDDENVLPTHQTSGRVNPFDRAPNLPPHLAEQLIENTRPSWFRSLFRVFRRPQTFSVAAPAFLDEVLPETTSASPTGATSSQHPIAIQSSQPSNNILNPNLSGSFKGDNNVVNDESPPQSIYEPITHPTMQHTTQDGFSDTDTPFILTPSQGGIGVAALPNNDGVLH